MNKTELIDVLAERLGDRKVAAKALDETIDIISRRVAKGERVGITGFGSFEKVVRPARTGRNPRTGESVKIRKTSVPKFRPGTLFKDTTSGKAKMGREPRPEPVLPVGVTGMRAVKEALGSKASTAKASTAKASTAKVVEAPKTGTTKAGTSKTGATKTSRSSAATKTAPAKAATKTPEKKASTNKAASTSAPKAAKKATTKSAPSAKAAAKKAAPRRAASAATK
ncbi:HU family DNA-binding protein [Nocardioides sp. Leaf285]|uniref:HU family DNA-binding protein n=1 Tax=Nocardioides sp. Leaf285 TaxID=1736322 RepID=UPI0007033E35|nr:HU family DNA-binding protein [Nocardioides sp. Leaf285]KQP62959.1 hypothetical protein ASF47_18275 [Nocardioides sp. Leaf285]